jgi:hypothetical protein
MLSFARSRFAPLAAVFAVVALSGCGPSYTRLTGTVSYSGQKLKGGTVTLVPQGEGMTVTEKIQEDGTYTFEKIRSGTYRVLIETESIKPPPQTPGIGTDGSQTNVPPTGANPPPDYPIADPSREAAARLAQRYVAIPSKYGDRNFTPLEIVVKGSSQSRNVELTD